MNSSILVINTGSSSLKFSLINIHSKNIIFSGLAEKLGQTDASITFQSAESKQTKSLTPGSHQHAMEQIMQTLQTLNLSENIVAIGHRVVHGGEQFKNSTIINDEVIAAIEKCAPYAPLHNPANLIGIKATMQAAPNLPQVAVFDTAFHQTIPKHAYLYAVPKSWYTQYGVRRYGFHGTSHHFVAQQAAAMLNIPLSNSGFISAHLGNGASATAILNGKSVDTTMGFTPLEGLVMGTRSGDIDPGLPPYIASTLGISAEAVVEMLNKKSGLLGLSGLSNDMRTLQEAAENGNEDAQIAIDVFVHRLARYIGALTVSLPKVDALIFTGGIGENSSFIRKKVIEKLYSLGYRLQNEANEKAVRGKQGVITTTVSIPAIVINTNEELMIAIETALIIK